MPKLAKQLMMQPLLNHLENQCGLLMAKNVRSKLQLPPIWQMLCSS
jgi:hypothetical protein